MMPLNLVGGYWYYYVIFKTYANGYVPTNYNIEFRVCVTQYAAQSYKTFPNQVLN